MTILPTQAAQTFARRAYLEDGEALTLVKLECLIYRAHGHCLALEDRPLVSDNFRAESNGPALLSLRKTLEYSPVISPDPGFEETSGFEKCLIGEVWDAYGAKHTGHRLHDICIMPDTPWHELKEAGRVPCVIPDALIKNYFVSLHN